MARLQAGADLVDEGLKTGRTARLDQQGVARREALTSVGEPFDTGLDRGRMDRVNPPCDRGLKERSERLPGPNRPDHDEAIDGRAGHHLSHLLVQRGRRGAQLSHLA